MKEGFGKLIYPNNSIFYEGEFHENSIFGAEIKIFYDNKKPLLCIHSTDSNMLEKITGECALYHMNGVTYFEGIVKDGYKEGKIYIIILTFFYYNRLRV